MYGWGILILDFQFCIKHFFKEKLKKIEEVPSDLMGFSLYSRVFLWEAGVAQLVEQLIRNQ